MRRPAVVATLLVGALCAASDASADTIVITSGFIKASFSDVLADEDIGISSDAEVALNGRGFSFHGKFTGFSEFENLASCLFATCSPGDLLPVGAFLPGEEFFNAELSSGAQTFRDVLLEGGLGILPANVSLPTGRFTLDPTSSLRGLMFRPGPPFDEIVVFPTHTFAGQGTFTFLGTDVDPFGNPRVSARYDFAPTPEPASLLLCLSGLVAACAMIGVVRSPAFSASTVADVGGHSDYAPSCQPRSIGQQP